MVLISVLLRKGAYLCRPPSSLPPAPNFPPSLRANRKECEGTLLHLPPRRHCLPFKLQRDMTPCAVQRQGCPACQPTPERRGCSRTSIGTFVTRVLYDFVPLLTTCAHVYRVLYKPFRPRGEPEQHQGVAIPTHSKRGGSQSRVSETKGQSDTSLGSVSLVTRQRRSEKSKVTSDKWHGDVGTCGGWQVTSAARRRPAP